MKQWLVGVLFVVSACSQSSQGPEGPQGPAGVAGAKGDKGEKGDTGAQGAPGVAGAPGSVGAPGVDGFSPVVSALDGGCVAISSADGGVATVCNGAPGAAGPTGAAGPAGERGDTGLTGLRGPAGPLVFSFSGTSGSSVITNNAANTATCWPVNGGASQSAPTSALPVVLATLLVPAGSSCSSIHFTGALTFFAATSPMSVQLAVYKNATRLGGGGAYTFLPLCTFSTTELCTNTSTVDVTENDQLAICFVSPSQPHPTQPRVAWSARCLAP